MSLIKSKQIERIIATYVRVNGFSQIVGGTGIVTAAITTALNTAGNGGTGVPVQDSPNVNTEGVIVAGSTNRVEVYNADTKLKMANSAGHEIYARLNSPGGIYTLTYYTLENGVETPYLFTEVSSIDFEFGYRFTFATLPADAILFIQARNVDDDPGGASNEKVIYELKTVTAVNTVNNLSKSPVSNADVLLVVNGKTEDGMAGGAFTVSGQAVAWNASNAGYSLATTDRVVAVYKSNQ